MFTVDDIKSCWSHSDEYLIQILNGEYSVEAAREDLKSLIGSRYDPRIKTDTSEARGEQSQ